MNAAAGVGCLGYGRVPEVSEDHDRCFSTLVLGAFSTGVFNTNALPHIDIGTDV